MKKTILAATILLALTTNATVVIAADEEDQDEEDKLLIVGSRSHKIRTIADSPVPVDIIDADELNSMGNISGLTDGLKVLVPSYTSTPATGDGSAFIRPTSLRGTAPDQTLVLVNGKRRHRSALVQFFAPAAGNGAHGVDISMIPTIAVKRVEVLRDGASSQYGSDAIAGVINFVMKDDNDEGEIQLQYGNFYEGEESTKFAINKGFSAGENAFVNLSLEYVDNEALSRGIQRPDAQALIDAGVEGVGADSPFGDSPLVQTWGRPETSALRFFVNSGLEIDENKKLYARLGYADTEGRYRFFYRSPGHSSLAEHRANGFTGLQAGFTPFLDGDQTDLSLSTGLEGTFSDGTWYDFSFGYGKNELDYFLNNTVNPQLGLVGGQIPQMDFDVGGYEQEEITLNADFSKLISNSLNLAFGVEYHDETYTVVAGEATAQLGSGPSGFAGILNSNSGDFSRDNFAAYLDLEHDISDDFMLQYAVRYEDFSDFGGTLNGKIAGRYNISYGTALRAAISTGFHAPTPGQANVSTTITTFDGASGAQVEERLISPTDPVALSLGGKELKEEESLNLSFGVTSNLTEQTTLTVDIYKIEVDDRIYRVGDIAVPGTVSDTISFYTNALDVEHTGLDLVLTSSLDWSDSISTDVSLAYSHNEIEVVSQKLINGTNPVSDSTVEDIENNYPEDRWVLTTKTPFRDDLSLMVRANFYGEHFDERGTINAEVQPSAEISSVIYVDAELSYHVSDNLTLKAGVANLFDEFPDEIGEENANRLSVGLQFPRRTVANYEGGSWYVAATYRF